MTHKKLHGFGRAAGQKKMQSQLARALDVIEAAMCVLLDLALYANKR